jgi:putative NADH-flavin reductase
LVKGAKLLKNSAAATLDVMSRSSVRRYLVVSQGLLFPSRNPFIALLRMILRRQVADSTAMEELICASDLAWTIVRPPKLSEGGKPQGYRTKVGAAPEGPWAMQYADLAQFLLDEAEQGRYPRAIVGITSG